MPRLFPTAVFVGLALLVSSPSFARVNAPDIQQFKPVTDTHGFVLLHDATLLPQFRPAFSFRLNYAMHPLEVQSGGSVREFGLVDGILGGDLTGAFGIFTFWEMGLHFPLIQIPLETEFIESPGVGGALVAFGIGDIRLETRLRPLDPAKFPVGLVANLFLTLPTGTETVGLGRGKPGGGLRVAVSQAWKRFHFAANLGYGFYPRATIANLTTGDEFTYGVGVGVSPIVDRLAIQLEFDGSLTGGPSDLGDERSFNGAHSPLEMLVSVRYKFKNGISIDGGLGKGLTAGFGSPRIRFFAGVSWGIFRPIDRDKDGIVDPDDDCIKDPEDKDDFEDSDGCPDPDNDADGVLDVDDGCPDVAEDADGFEDEDGCPDTDNDGDGVDDVDDGCPMDPEDADGFEDEDGCPDLDNDQDGVPDLTDACPLNAETFDGWADEDGCPDPDNDQDGILDEDDLCPDEAEVVNKVKDEDGCPDDILAVRASEAIVILEKLYFASGRDRILRRSDSVLRAVAAVLRGNPDILQVRVEGHTDSRGRESTNQKLSQRRSEAVMRRLIKEGIDAGRLEAVGYGESRPIAPNESETGRERNRRVEFKILAQGMLKDVGSEQLDLWGAEPSPAAEE
ncbi:MAG TPA: cell envelope biogenesis protein OmpA [Deltaproteobacteria bacterium]|nr:cell envelope biogenesis protein OmpA [Deltaproteobacteria bacterium]HCP46852.1 cell envelope biogenesis protein OmpA [Deltaproteobacteria bacterium]